MSKPSNKYIPVNHTYNYQKTHFLEDLKAMKEDFSNWLQNQDEDKLLLEFLEEIDCTIHDFHNDEMIQNEYDKWLFKQYESYAGSGPEREEYEDR